MEVRKEKGKEERGMEGEWRGRREARKERGSEGRRDGGKEGREGG